MPHTLALLALFSLLAALAPTEAIRADEVGTFEVLGHHVAPGSKDRVNYYTEASFLQESLDVDGLVAHGVRSGPTLCLTAAVHGDEINGVEIARRILDDTDAKELSGTLLAIPAVNAWGFRNRSRYLADRRDLNRAFPGSARGSLAERLAFALFESVIRRCDALIDLHTGSDERANLPQIRVDVTNERSRELALQFGADVVLAGAGPLGSLRRSAVEAGVPAIIYEAGGPNEFQHHEIERGVEGVENVMRFLGMVSGTHEEPGTRIFHQTSWLRSPSGGIFLSDRAPGEVLEAGAMLGTVTDPVTSERHEVTAPHAGTLIGMAKPQLVLPGYGLFHVAADDE